MEPRLHFRLSIVRAQAEDPQRKGYLGKWLLLLAFVAWAAPNAFVQFSPAVRGAVRAVAAATSGWINPTLVANAATVALLCLVLFGIGRLRPGDLHVDRRRAASGLGAAVAFWAAWQLALLALSVYDYGSIRLGTRWLQFDPALVIGMLGAMFFVAAGEELWFRGVLLTQLRLRLHRLTPAVALTVSVLVTSLLFGAVHLWTSSGGSVAGKLAFHAFNGAIFAALMLLSRNLWLAIGVHWLGNWGLGSPVFQTATSPVLALVGLKVGLVVVWLTMKVRSGAAPESGAAGRPIA